MMTKFWDQHFKPVPILQWLVAIVLSTHVLISSKDPLGVGPSTVYVLVLLISNVTFLYLLPRFISLSTLTTILVVLDTLLVPGTLYVTGSTGTDLYVVYFGIMLIAGASGNLKRSLILAAMICVAYGVFTLWSDDDSTPLEAVLLRMPFFLVMTMFYGSLAEYTRRIQADREKMAYAATHDDLTGMPNRQLLHDRLQQAIRAGHREKKPLALLMMDLDRFKEINDTLGHLIGDRVLQEAGRRIRDTLGKSDTVARLGGDEFALLLLGARVNDAILVVEKVQKALAQPFILDELSLTIEASFGIVLCPEHGEETNTLIRRADVAMYVAKRAGSGYALYAWEQDQYTPHRLMLISELRHAIELNQLVLHYQPKISLRTGRITGVEALVQWQHPQHGLIPPAEFISLAEQTGMIKPLTLWVLKEALRQCQAWHQAGLTLSVAVNLSARNLQDPQLVDHVAGFLETFGVAPGRLELEITESAIMADPTHALETLTRLSAMGVRLAIDDFGTGYSSLSYLKKLPVNEVKIDQSFVINMATDDNDAVIVRSTIDLAHNLGLTVVAEGVETQESWDWLAARGCDVAQGYWMSHPLPVADLMPWLRESLFGVGKFQTPQPPLT